MMMKSEPLMIAGARLFCRPNAILRQLQRPLTQKIYIVDGTRNTSTTGCGCLPLPTPSHQLSPQTAGESDKMRIYHVIKTDQ